ncbi:MAG: DUF3164 family protein [Rikenellaceae bacterium]
METQQTQVVEMTAEELASFEAFKQHQQVERVAAKAQEDRDAYRALVDETIEAAIPELLDVSNSLKVIKQTTVENFYEVLKMKSEVLGLKPRRDGKQNSHTFTNSTGDKRVRLGVYEIDGWLDTVNDGIAIVTESITDLAQDERTQGLVDMVMDLLAKDGKGNLKASRIFKLRKSAEKLGNQRILDGVKIIEESYLPSTSKQYVRVEIKNEQGAWVNVPLGMTEV